MPSAAYLAQIAAPSRQVQWLVEIDLDRCTRSYTVAPCTAVDQGDGNRCYFSFPTCQDPANYLAAPRTYRFCLNTVPWTDPAQQVYPYLVKPIPVPQDVDPSRLTTYPEKLKLEMCSDWLPPVPDSDKPLFNSAIVGEFWRNLKARSRNYPNRPLRIYRGFASTGFLLADFEKVGPTYRLRGIEINGDTVTIIAESEQLILNKINVPETISQDNTIQNAGGINAAVTTVDVLRASEYPDPALYTRFSLYVEINEIEICQYTARDTTLNRLTIVRGRLGTTAATHAAGVKVSHVAFFGTDNGASDPTARNVVEVMQDLLHWAKIPVGSVTTASFDAVKDGAWPESDILRIVRTPAKIARHLQPLRETRGVAIYLDAAGKWAAAVMAPAATVADLDENHFVLGSVEVTEDDETRLTRAALWYDPIVENPGDDPKDYAKGAKAIDVGLEAANNMGDQRDKLVFDAWLDPSIPISFALNQIRRLVTRLRYGQRKIVFELELLDNVRNVGDLVTLSTRLLLDRDGIQDVRVGLITAKKEVSLSRSEYSAADVNYSGRFLRIGPDTLTDSYDAATNAERLFGWWGDADNRVGAVKDEGYVFW